MIRFLLICIFLLLFFIISIPLYLVVLIVGLFSKEARAKASQAIACLGFRIILVISGTRVVISGLENVPKDTPVLYVSNHRSYYDIVTCYPLVKNNTAFLSKKEMLKFPFVNIWMILMNCQFLDRDDLRKGMKTIAKCTDLLKGNTSVFVFPEGTRGLGGEMKPFKEGTMRIAVKSGSPIVPVAVYNTENIFETHIPKVQKATVTVTFGKPIDPTGLSPAEKKHLGARTQAIIQEMMLENIPD